MNQKLEYVTVQGEYDLNRYAKEGYEVVDIFYESYVEDRSVPAQNQTYVSVSTDGNIPPALNNYQNTSYRTVPVVVPHPKFLMRLSKTAKILYGEKGNVDTPQS